MSIFINYRSSVLLNMLKIPNSSMNQPFAFLSLKVEKTLIKSRFFRGASILCNPFGGEEVIRTLAPLSRPTPLAGAPLHQLEYFSVYGESQTIFCLP